jgi:hypothetical protein
MKVGQTVWVTGGFRRDNKAEADVIEKIGNKYFYLVGDRGQRKFDIQTLKQVSESNYPAQVYLSLEEYQDKLEAERLSYKIKDFIQRGYGKLPLTLDQLKAIDKIISGENL